jgi:hypothetical protein
MDHHAGLLPGTIDLIIQSPVVIHLVYLSSPNYTGIAGS